MKDQILLPEAGYYKANLYCHTTLSDGEFTPEQIKAAYQEQGYSIVAFTDHRQGLHQAGIETSPMLPQIPIFHLAAQVEQLLMPLGGKLGV